MKVLCTGGAGYVGSTCLRSLQANGHEAVAFDDLSLGHRQAVADGDLIVGDINDTQAISKALRDVQPDAVMHFAALTYVGESVDNPEDYYRNNVAGTLNLLSAMREAEVHRLVFSSTCATYGESPVVPMSEDAPQEACSPYARTKLAVEWMIRDFCTAYGLGYTLLRYFNAAGASSDAQHGEDHEPETHLIPLVLQVALKQRKKLLVFGSDYPTPDGTCLRDYIHVEDVAQAHLLTVDATEPGHGDVFNVGTGTGNSVLEVIQACESAVGCGIPYEVAGRRPGDAPALVADPKKIISELGWKPRFTDICQIVETAWRWHEQHPNGYRTKETTVAAG